MAHNSRPVQRPRGFDPYLLLTIAAALVYIWIFAGLAFDFHAGLRTHKSDLGQMDQAVWNTSRGRFLETVKDDFITTRMTDHVEPIFVLISPVLWLWNDVRALLLLQVVAAGTGALFLYDLARTVLARTHPPGHRSRIWLRETVERLTRPLALALALAYLLTPHLQAAILTEFHAIPLSVPLILWGFWAVEKRRWGQAVLAALLVASVKEEAALLGAGLGAWLLWRAWLAGNRSRPVMFLGSGTVALCLAWFYLATFVIVPAHALPVYGTAESGYFQRYGALGNSPLDILRSFFVRPGLVWQIATEPVRAQYLIRLLAAYGFVSVLGVEVLLLCLPVFLANQLSAYPGQYYGEFHYSAPIVPYFAVAAVYGTARLWRLILAWTDRRSESFQHASATGAPFMAVVSVFTNAQSALRPLASIFLAGWLLAWGASGYLERGRGPLAGRYDPTPVSAHDRLLARFVRQVPPDAPLTATAALHPHVSHRRYVYQFPWGLDAEMPATWALLDVTGDTDMAPGDVKSMVDAMLAGQWGVVDAADGYLLLQRGAEAKEIPQEFYSFVLVPDPSALSPSESEAPAAPRTQFATRNTFAFGPLTFLGADLLDWPLWRRTKISTFWRVEPGFSPQDAVPWMEVRQPDGTPIYSYGQIPPVGLLWYPPERWQTGDVIRLETLWLFLPRHWGLVVGPGRPAAVAAGFSRTDRGPLQPLPVMPFDQEFSYSMLSTVLATRLSERGGTFRLNDTTVAQVTARIPAEPVPAGQPVDVWLAWQVADQEKFQAHAVFVHLRDANGNVSQQDGPPRLFLPLPADGESAPDWRQLPLPSTLAPGRYAVVVGLFDPNSGQRLTAVDDQGQEIGNELAIGHVTVSPPLIPDQTCALIPEACLSQGKRN